MPVVSLIKISSLISYRLSYQINSVNKYFYCGSHSRPAPAAFGGIRSGLYVPAKIVKIYIFLKIFPPPPIFLIYLYIFSLNKGFLRGEDAGTAAPLKLF
jgi:hypothetical protein